jgi:multidrug resistance efflux pump
MKRVWIAIAIATAVTIVAWVIYRSVNGRPDERILLSGNTELTEISITFKVPEKLIERTVDEGDNEKKGMRVARIDRDQLLRTEERERAGLGSSRQQLEEALSSVQCQEKALEADFEQRRSDLKAYEAQYEELIDGSRPQEIRDAKAAVDSAQAEYARASNDWKRMQMLYQRDEISALQFDQYRRSYETAEAGFRSAKQKSELVVIGPREETIEAAAAQVRRARAGLQAAEADEIELRRRRQEVTGRREEVKRQIAQMGVVASQLDDTIATSPIDGVVLVKAAEMGKCLRRVRRS